MENKELFNEKRESRRDKIKEHFKYWGFTYFKLGFSILALVVSVIALIIAVKERIQ